MEHGIFYLVWSVCVLVVKNKYHKSVPVLFLSLNFYLKSWIGEGVNYYLLQDCKLSGPGTHYTG